MGKFSANNSTFCWTFETSIDQRSLVLFLLTFTRLKCPSPPVIGEADMKTRSFTATLFLAAAVLLSSSVAASANTIVLTAVVGNLYQQTVQSPCVFENPS